MNGVQTRFKCKLDVKRCKRFVFPPSSLLPRSNALKTKAIRYFQTDRTLTRIVSPPLGTPTNGVKPSMESTFHLGVLRERPDVNVVLHFQSEYATAISCMKNKPTNFNVTAEIPCHVGSEIPVIPYYRPGSPELAKAVVEAMLKHNSVLLTNHGQVVCGKDFDQVYERATFFEMACRIIVQSGGDYSVLTPEEIEDLEIYVLGKKTK